MSVTMTGVSITSLGVRALLATAVLLTVGAWAAVGATLLLAADMILDPGRKFLGTAAVVLFAAIPLVWLLGSTLPMAPPVPRIQDNVLAHQLGGLAVWTLVFAVVTDHRTTKREQT